MDITDSLAPASDQLDAIELTSPRTFRIKGVIAGSAEQPVQIQLEDFPRVWRPSKSMRRVLAACWGTDASVYAGRSVRLYCDPNVMFGKDKVGGTRIESLTHIDKPVSVPLLISRGKSAVFTVQPLVDITSDITPQPSLEAIATCTDEAQLKSWWHAGDAAVKAAVTARKGELDGAV